jgi:hypothetical protein
VAEEGQHASDRSARPISEGLTQLISDPWIPILEAPGTDLKPSLFDRMLWWLSAAMIGAAAFIAGVTLTARLLP